MAEHVHADVIRAWAGGAQIQYRNKGGEWWDCIEVPSWLDRVEYRVKPAESATGYPETKMSPGDLGAQLVHAMVGAPDAYDFSLHSMDRLTGFANAILKRAIDDGTVPTKEAYELCARDLKRAEETLTKAGYTDNGGELWKPPLGNPSVCVRMLEAEDLLKSLGYRRTHEGEWEAPMPASTYERDRAIARAVRGWYERQYPTVGCGIVQPDLEHIIRGVK